MTETQKRLVEKLKRELGDDIVQALSDPDVVEVMLNPDGKLWIEKMGKEMECVGTPHINPKAAIGTIASYLDTAVTADNPILECELPLDGSRFEGLTPPVVTNTTFAIRKKAIKIFTLEDYLVES